MRHTYVCHDRTAREQCQQNIPLRVTLGARGELLCRSTASCSVWLSGSKGTEMAGATGVGVMCELACNQPQVMPCDGVRVYLTCCPCDKSW